MLKHLFIILGIINCVPCSKHSSQHEKHKATHLTIEIMPSNKQVSQSSGETESSEEAISLEEPTTSLTTTPAEPTKSMYRQRIHVEQHMDLTDSPQQNYELDVKSEDISFGTTTRKLNVRATAPITTMRPISSYDWKVWCKMQAVTSDCEGSLETRYYFNTKIKKCTSGSVSSCAHNVNQFNSFRSCHRRCKATAADVLEITNPSVLCRLQPEFGDCYEYHPMYYYDMDDRNCKGFSYSGCGGNSNKFTTMQECNIACSNTVKLRHSSTQEE